ncbi:MAG: hypothetical protein WDN49_25855 [Acetobacteraceae bacterium]
MKGERRWIVIVEDGRHSTLGRHTDPSEAEILAAEAALKAAGLSGWLAVSNGVYYSNEELSVLQVRMLGQPMETWETAAERFLAIRQKAIE